MSGNRYLLDTNAIVALLQGNPQIIQLLQNADWIGVSVISQIEFLAFSELGQNDCQLFQQFLQRVEVIGLVATDTMLIEKIIEIRQQFRLKCWYQVQSLVPSAMAVSMSSRVAA
jgi:predicted nucleic acid-binding protein